LRAPSVDLEPLVTEMRAGIVATFGHWRFAYTYALGTKTYRTGRDTHAFGSVNIARLMR